MTLFDAYGRPVDTGRLEETQAEPTLAGIRNIFSVEHPTVGLTPQRLTAIMRDAEVGDPYLYLELAEEMEEKDAHYLSTIATRKHAVGQLEFSVTAASDSSDDIKRADYVREVLLEGSLDLPAAVFTIEDAIGKGFSATEIIWEKGGREWRPEKLQWRDPRWFMPDWISGEQILVRTLKMAPTPGDEAAAKNGGGHLAPGIFRGNSVGIQPATAPLDPFKFITHFALAKSGLPIRGGLARAMAGLWLYKNYILKDWVVFAEVYGQPLRVGKYGPGATAQDKQQLLRAVTNIGTDASAIIPDSMLIEFVKNSTERASADLYEKLAQYIDNQMSKAILGQTLSAELPKGGGSRAAAQVHDTVRRDIAADDAAKLSAALNRDLVRPIVDLNLGPPASKRYPQIKIGFPDEEDLERLGTALAIFIDRGLPVSQKAILDKFGLSEIAPGEPILHPVAKETGQLPGGAPPDDTDDTSDMDDADARPRAAQNSSTHAAVAEPHETHDAINRFVDKLCDENSDGAMKPVIEPLLAAMRGSTSWGDMKRQIVAAVREGKVDLADFADLVARAGFALNLTGNMGLRVTKPARR